MKTSNEKTVFEKRADTMQNRLLFINNLMRRRRAEAVAGILALVALHFVAQFIIFPEENFLVRRDVPEPRIEQKTAPAAEPKAVPAPDTAVKNQPEESPAQVVHQAKLSAPKTEDTPKKQRDARPEKAAAESRAARLRRAEKLLTGN